MLKYIGVAVLVLLVAGSWFKFYQVGKETNVLEEKIQELINAGDPEEEIPEMRKKLAGIEGEQVFSGILLTFMSAGLIGIVVVTQLLPRLAQKMTHAVYDSGEEVEADPFHDARVLIAQGEWEGAIEAFKAASQQDPLNRMPWVEIAKIQRLNLENPAAAIATLRQAIEGQEWEVNDAAFLMFRLSEIYREDFQDIEAAVALMEQIIEQFPETRHSANARTKLHEWGMT